MKRLLYIVSVLMVSLLLVGSMLMAVLMSDEVETAAVRLVASELSRGLGTEASIGGVAYQFPARVRVNDIYIEDQQSDTLLYLSEVDVHLRAMPLLKREIRLSRVHVLGGRVNVYPLSDGRQNYSFLVDAFGSDKQKERKSFGAFLSVRDIRIEGMRARYASYEGVLHHAYMDLYYLTSDSIGAEIGSFAACVRKGQDSLSIEELQAQVVYNDSLVGVPRLYVRLPHSEVDAGGLEYLSSLEDTMHLSGCKIDHTTRSGRLLHERNSLSIHIHNADMRLQDLSLLVPSLRHIDKQIRLTGDIVGRMDSIVATNLSLHYNNRRLFLGEMRAVGLPDLTNPYLQMHCEDLHVNARFLQDFISDYANKPFLLPVELHRLGDIHYKGQIEGRLHDIALHGAFRTGLGVITTEGNLRSDTLFAKLDYNMRVATHRFHLGKLLGHKPIGPIAIDVRTKGRISDGVPNGGIIAYIRNFTYNGYTYQEIRARGQYSHKRWDGTFSIDDENLSFGFSGLVDLSQEQPDINCDMRLGRFRPSVISPSPTLTRMELGGKVSINLSGLNLDEMSGYLVADSVRLRNGNDSVMMQQLKLVVQASDFRNKQIRLTSDFLTAGIDGQFRYKDLSDALLRQAVRYLPNAFTVTERSRIEGTKETDSRVDFYFYGHGIQTLQRVLRLPSRMSDQPVVKGFFHEDEALFGLMAYVPAVRLNSLMTVNDITLSLDNIGERANLSLSAEAFQMGALLQASAGADTLRTRISLHQTDTADHVYGGNIQLKTHFAQYAGKPLIELHVEPSYITLKDSTYTLADSRIAYNMADTTIDIKDFGILASHQYIRANGMVSPHNSDSLHIELGNIDVAFVLPFVLPEKTLTVGGSLTGWATLYGLFSAPVFEADVRLDSALLNNTYIGDAIATVALDKETNNVLIDGDVVLDKKTIAHVDGKVETAEHKWGLMIYPDSVPLGFINHWTRGILSDISGYAQGKVHVFGEREGMIKRTWVETQARAIDAALTIPFTGCRYYFSDSVFMDSTSIQFRHLDLHDEEGHRIHLNGALHHTLFENFEYGFEVGVDDALVFDLPEKTGEMLQGHVYARGHADIQGDMDDVRIDVDAQTVGKSRFRFSIDNASTASDNQFITFVDHTAPPLVPAEVNIDSLFPTIEELPTNTRVQLAMNIDVTPNLLFQLILGERNGDMIQSRGSGALRFTYDSQNEDIKLMGQYGLQQGSLDFTVGNVIRRKFTIAEGSSILWTGSPMEPELDVTAKYRVTASLKDLFGSEVEQLATSRTSVPVNTNLTMTGSLLQPTLQFGIELPLSDESVQSQVRAIINTDEMLMRQVVYLLVFGRFFTPEYMSNSQFSGLNDTYSLLSSTITGQINSWLSKLTNVFTMGVNIRTDGEGADASQEYEAEFQLQPIDRLVINGNVGYRYNDISNQPFFGDLDVEVLLTEDGKLRLKGYTHTVDKYSLRQASTIQGIGFIWKHDFNWSTKEERAKRKEERARRKVTLQMEKATEKAAKKATRQVAQQDTTQ